MSKALRELHHAEQKMIKGKALKAVDLMARDILASVGAVNVGHEPMVAERRNALDDADAAYERTLTEAANHLEARWALAAFGEQDLAPGAAAWPDERWSGWTPPDSSERILRLGDVLPRSRTLARAVLQPVPAVVAFPEDRALMFDAVAAPRRGIEALQSALLRVIAGQEPGTFSLGLIDPKGLGESFSPFLHLEELDSSILTARVASQPSAIEQLLDQTLAHLETVTQQYLRSSYASLREYNAAAGEVAERLRFLAIADYPAGFDSRTATKLRSIVDQGPRCGVYVVLHAGSAAADHGVPSAIELGEAPILVRVGASGEATVAGWPDAPATVRLEQAPDLTYQDVSEPQSLLGQILISTAVAGRSRTLASVTQKRAFEVMAASSGWREGADGSTRAVRTDPHEPATWWSAQTTDAIEMPIGRAGARDVCTMRFDSKALASALVVGAPGMGKTTLLHAVILGACLQYSPDELELYLLDSKQGVEFKVYERLPHARAVAIRNEREFGVSVLEGLRAELDRRAGLLKAMTGGSEVDLPGFRRATSEPLPRVLLVADEFHELFERVDRLGQRAAELLDDLVRQGRSYGIHVLLGSQTLEGTDALPKHTIQLVQSRVVFACREQDAAMAMREDNREVLALSKPGDGLYNPSRGAPEANVRFQGILIEPAARVALCAELAARAPDRRPLVFDGDQAFALDALPIEAFEPAADGTLSVRVGEPCAITGAVWARLPRRPGANLLAVADEATRRALLHATLAAGSASPGSRVRVLDLLGDEDPVLQAFTAARDVAVMRRRRAGELLSEIAAIASQRQELDEYAAPTVILAITGLKGLRDPEEPIADDRSFSDLLEGILRDGPEVGVHVVLLADTPQTLARRVDRGIMRELGVRFTTRVSRRDSEELLETEVAAELRPHQALLFDDAESTLEKTRAYTAAGPGWIAALTSATGASAS